ncbi:hypothetical protein EVJ32_04670 [Exiguobacterium sp. SH5S4]|uniref:hypothetical protein n=1 Tax=Exiguobacterium sp. SH5S4 TaxID=2510961 RepID=UPI00103A1A1F|nr:hypothetical protein [Exiguobacterium sp. SH5S4]TCI26671.1 hypothetical protein EVJ32_04670 [Exiguobacterium sp. SH5S4]
MRRMTFTEFKKAKIKETSKEYALYPYDMHETQRASVILVSNKVDEVTAVYYGRNKKEFCFVVPTLNHIEQNETILNKYATTTYYTLRPADDRYKSVRKYEGFKRDREVSPAAIEDFKEMTENKSEIERLNKYATEKINKMYPNLSNDEKLSIAKQWDEVKEISRLSFVNRKLLGEYIREHGFNPYDYKLVQKSEASTALQTV